tara:strand:+ start:213 stop:524 length:312 start_codon:yes stop_codon:yes gene_type:complete
MATKTKIKDIPLYTYDKYECWWEDHASACEWKSIKDAVKDKPEICFTEGYLLKKDKDCIIFVMSFSGDEIGEEMIISNKNILALRKIGTKTFYEKDFVYGEWK